jgi:hypothetical protein
MNLDQYDYYLVLDLEATCCDKKPSNDTRWKLLKLEPSWLKHQL